MQPCHSDADKTLSRRDLLRVGGVLVSSSGLSEVLRARAAGAERSPPDTAVIQVFLGGGPSHIDTYDPKPHAPREIRGEFDEVSTSVSGIRFGEHLPLQAEIADKLVVLRSLAHTSSEHLIGSQLMLTGRRPDSVTPDNIYPSTGSIAARLRGANAPGLPPYVAVPRKTSYGNAAYLGLSYNPLATEGDLTAQDFEVRSVRLTEGLSVERVEDRVRLRQALDLLRSDAEGSAEFLALDRFSEQAVEMITSPRAQRAFDLSREDEALRDEYGRTQIGQGCLLARRLVEAGVTYVTVLSGGGWDTHVDNFRELREVSLPRYDRAIAALVRDLHQRGLDRRVLLVAYGEFGRTPKINAQAGRDHWPGAMSAILAGGGLKVGQAIGKTDRHGAAPIERELTPGGLLATMYRFLGIDYRHELRDGLGRPMPVLPEGEPIQELF